ncbi:hypothetical protein BO70DRAFT_365906 [Aspergillus heteromorphus CBS 117.55]|uniref:Uncharacterized protein n=1 Tax=Aspergillus heteromorphus CBS 117.55 TaxID=1448321 RepID=A0A317V491_9EURO|nr:uncharacterized protein BO70DRAFT_365906 [Aspergillus heteromorphus CBS 117.55]PWY69093.1 hypothetical protein BO70DRAFT_365906 [Aspergillus heteromorphus CBS 117.55]
MTTYERAAFKHVARPPSDKVYFNPLDDVGRLVLNHQFMTPQEARVALLDTTVYSIGAFQDWEEITRQAGFPCAAAQSRVLWVAQATERWKVTFEDLVRRKESTWNRAERNACDAIRLLWHSVRIGTDRHRVGTESGWDTFRANYEDILEIVERLVGETGIYHDEISRTLTLDTWVMYPLQTVAWKCRWPHLRRRALDLLLRIPKHEFIFYVPHYHTICSRIIEIEEACLNLSPGTVPSEDQLIPDTARVYDFSVAASPTMTDEHPLYSITFMTLPHGTEGAPVYHTEPLWLPPPPAGASMTPFNLMTRREWSQVGRTNRYAVESLSGVWV